MRLGILIIAYSLSWLGALAQPQTEARYEIDAKRIGVYCTSENALASAREYKRIDSTYYVGLMYEGAYRYERAADYRGFKLAAEQLQKAIDLLYKDFKKEITTRTTSFEIYYKDYQLRQDFDYMAYLLMNCYSNMERADLVWQHLQFCKKVNVQQETYMDTYCYLAWTVHRNRFYTNKKYKFLKNSIMENELYANSLLDTARLKLLEDAKLNDKMFMGDYYASSISSVWHYLSILYSYQLNIDKAAEIYDKLKGTYYFPENNYATFCAIQGKFREASFYYNQAKELDQGDKRLNESFYYSSILNVYRAHPKVAIQELKDVLSANGTTPGFGWYNLALCRALLYDGQLEVAKKHATTAEQFNEIHRGTTLGKSHYDLTASLLQLVVKEKELYQLKFMNKYWWYYFSSLLKVARLSAEKYGLQFLIINQLAANPERELVIYKLFSTENTVSYDEIWYLIKDFSSNFFLKKYTQYAETDDRPLLRKYYEYFIAKLHMEKGEYRVAMKMLKQIIDNTEIDLEYERLYIARVYLAYAECLSVNGQGQLKKSLHQAYKYYPQLIPFESLAVRMRLRANAMSFAEKKIIGYLHKRNIEWVEANDSSDAIDVLVEFGKQDNYPTIAFECSYQGEKIVNRQIFSYDNPEDAADELALYLFNIGNDAKSFNMNDSKGNLYSLSGSQVLNKDFK